MSNNTDTLRAGGHRPAYRIGTEGRERMVALAPGTVRPTGWVRRLAEIEADNWMEMIVRKDEHNLRRSFFDGSETPHGGEWSGYWNDSFIGLSILLGDEERLRRVQEHIEEILATAEGNEKFLSEWYSGWGSHLQIRALMTWFEATGDERVLDLCHRVALELLDDLSNPDGHTFDGDHPVNMASSCTQLYGYTGNERLIPMAEEIMRRFDIHGLPNMDRLLHADRLAGHCVNYCEDIRHPADVYLFSGNPDHLRASIRGVELTERDHLQVHGVPTGNEPVNGRGPMKETEHCDTVEWSMVGHALLTATGEAKWADLTEKVLFNAWAGSRKWNSRSLCYNHSPNQLTASAWEGTWVPRMNYSAYHQPQCCNLNSHRAVHPYANRMWMLTADGAPAAVYYGDCTLKLEVPNVGLVEFTERTDYPFGEDVNITVSPERTAAFPISLRIPGWCTNAQISVNGETIEGKPEAGTLHAIEREWKPGDSIDLHLPMPISIEWAETFEEPAFHDVNHLDANPEHSTQIGLRPVDEPIAGRHLVAVSRGPIVYTLYIKPAWVEEPFEGTADGYPMENVVQAEDAGPWNVALVLDKANPEGSFEFVRLSGRHGDEPFKEPSVGLKCKARVIPDWEAAGDPGKPLTTLPDYPYEASGEEVEALLVPFGCTQIRLTWLPFVLE